LLLIVTNRDDLTADWLILELHRRGSSFVRFNTEDYPTRVQFSWSVGEGQLVLADGQRVPLRSISAVWYRRPVPPVLPDTLDPDRHSWAQLESQAALEGVWRTLDALWVNHPVANRVADSKPYQLQIAQQLGLRVPPSLVTNSAADATAFAGEHASSIICKPLANGRVRFDGEERLFFTSQVPLWQDFAGLGPEPYLFQALIPKAYDVRVTVIGREVFATRIDSQTEDATRVDWRRSDSQALRHSAETLPDLLIDVCRSLTAHFQLEFAAIDFARTPEGDYVFFEVNSSGQWAWIEQLTGQPLRSALADLLLSPRASGE
jgi:hypothetical protein